jgi:hypothetical protein
LNLIDASTPEQDLLTPDRYINVYDSDQEDSESLKYLKDRLNDEPFSPEPPNDGW